jgi:probable F420-dependent oxidoreductase
MPWSQPAARMREFVLALRAIFDAFEGVEKLDFRGDFYKHTLLTPFFTPTRSAFGPPPILLAAVGERMTEVAGEVCDGLVFHPLSTERYFREVTESALARGAARSGRRLDAFERTGLAFVTVGRNDEEMARAREGTKSQIAFYASTPAYRGVLALHGREALQPELTKLTKAGRWKDLGPLIDDEFLGLVSVIGTPEDVGRGVAARYGPLATRIQLYAPYRSDPAIWPIVVDAIRREA